MICFNYIFGRAHQQVIKLFGRGIEDDTKITNTACFPCSCVKT